MPSPSNQIEQPHIYYEVSPYYVMDLEYPVGRSPIRQKVQAGFDVDLYATGAEKPLHLSVGDQQLRATQQELQEFAREVLPPANGLDVSIIPFEDELVLDTHRNLRPEARIRIRIAHWRGVNEPAGPTEEQALSRVRDNLRKLGVAEGARS
jgi:hypothetical protein